jgi:hypothetical protein
MNEAFGASIKGFKGTVEHRHGTWETTYATDAASPSKLTIVRSKYLT